MICSGISSDREGFEKSAICLFDRRVIGSLTMARNVESAVSSLVHRDYVNRELHLSLLQRIKETMVSHKSHLLRNLDCQSNLILN